MIYAMMDATGTKHILSMLLEVFINLISLALVYVGVIIKEPLYKLYGRLQIHYNITVTIIVGNFLI